MKMTAHTIQWSDKKIEVRRGIRHVSSMWKEARVCTSKEIVLE